MWKQKEIGAVLGGLALLMVYGCGGALPPAASGPEADRVDVGYGTQDAADVTGAVSSINMDDVSTIRSPRIEEYLEGRVPGLYVLRTPYGYSLRIRGVGTLTGSSEPLVVIDGIPVPQHLSSSTLSSINPADVQRVEVLKDAGSAAIYGSRGANGVIIITTRRGR